MNTFFSNGSYSRNVYSASGVKLKTEHYTSLATPVSDMSTDMTGMDAFMDSDMGIDAAATGGGSYEISGLDKMEYHGPVIYRNGKIDMVQFPGGYVTIDGSDVTFHYYTQDYLGNNRAVINGSTGAIEQTTAYYPYGAVIADLGTGNSGQPFKFIGKELISANGINEYDFGARRQYPAIPQFTSIDPLCEKYYHLSPYLYCGNDPVNAFDPNGMELVFTGGEKKDYKYICTLLSNATQNQYKFFYKINKESKCAKISYSINDKFKDKLTDNQTRVNKEITKIIDSDKSTSINIKNNSEVIIGDVRTKSIDLADIANIGNREAVTSESALLHEVYEQSYLQSKDKAYNDLNVRNAHNAANALEELYLNLSISSARIIHEPMGNNNITIPFNKQFKEIIYPDTVILNLRNWNVLP